MPLRCWCSTSCAGSRSFRCCECASSPLFRHHALTKEGDYTFAVRAHRVALDPEHRRARSCHLAVHTLTSLSFPLFVHAIDTCPGCALQRQRLIPARTPTTPPVKLSRAHAPAPIPTCNDEERVGFVLRGPGGSSVLVRRGRGRWRVFRCEQWRRPPKGKGVLARMGAAATRERSR